MSLFEFLVMSAGLVGLVWWLRYEYRLLYQPPRHLYQVVDAIQCHHPNTVVGNFQQQYLC